MYKWPLILLLLLYIKSSGMGHPMPHSIFSLSIKSNKILAELNLPLKELQLAVPFDVTNQVNTLAKDERRKLLIDYLMAHIHPKSMVGTLWTVDIYDLKVEESLQEATGKYQELVVLLSMTPPVGETVRSFELNYDAILHQVITHKVFVNLKQDWQNGKTDRSEQSLGVIEFNIGSNKILPLPIRLDEGSMSKGFITMVRLGMNHISEGLDHLLFLLVLLLPVTLKNKNGRWTTFVGTKNSFINIIKIVTAFTLGHSVSLFVGAQKWLVLPQQPVEIAIALTILITAIHGLYPIFKHREIFIATAFGLIHGLAFSTILSDLNLETKELFYSILGFNIGIELMQIFVIILIIPWLIILSKNDHYTWIRLGGAVFAMIAALAWMIERIQFSPNFVSTAVDNFLSKGKWIALFLMICAALSTMTNKKYPKIGV